MTNTMKHLQRGISLVELAVAMTIVAILSTMASNTYSVWMANVQVRTATESIQNGLQLARAEAIRRNRSVFFWLTTATATGGADWLVGCSTPVGNGAGGIGEVPEQPGDCPGPVGVGAAPAWSLAAPHFWIQYQLSSAQQTSAAQVAVANGGDKVTFNSLGLVTANADGTPTVNQIIVSNPNIPAATAKPLWVVVGAAAGNGGAIRMCDPSLALANDPRGCQ